MLKRKALRNVTLPPGGTEPVARPLGPAGRKRRLQAPKSARASTQRWGRPPQEQRYNLVGPHGSTAGIPNSPQRARAPQLLQPHLLVLIVLPLLSRNLKARLAVPKRNGIWVLDRPGRSGSLRSETWAAPAAEASPGGGAQRARRPAVGEKPGGVEAGGTFSGPFGVPGDPKWVEGHQPLPSPGICPLSAGTRPPPSGLSSSPSEARRVAGAQHRQRPGLSRAPGQPRGLRRALPTRAGEPGSRLLGSGGGPAGLNARCSRSLEPGRGDPTWEPGRADRRRQPQRGTHPSAVPAAGTVGAAMPADPRQLLSSPRRASRVPTAEKGATAPSAPGSPRGSPLQAAAAPPRGRPVSAPRVRPPAAPAQPRAGLRPRPRLTCEQQPAEQRAQQDPGVLAADHGERDAACSPGPRSSRATDPAARVCRVALRSCAPRAPARLQPGRPPRPG